jgi:hypothetical protein
MCSTIPERSEVKQEMTNAVIDKVDTFIRRIHDGELTISEGANKHIFVDPAATEFITE